MTTLLQSYEDDYRDTAKSFTDELAALRTTLKRDAPDYKAPPSAGAGSRVQMVSHLNTLLTHLREVLSSMDYECNDLPAAHRQTAKERVTGYRKTVKDYEEAVAKVKAEASQQDRLDLMGSKKKEDGTAAPGDLDDETKQHRMQMMGNTQKVRDASGKLLQAERLLNDTETIGNEALTTLRNQTETMHQIQGTTIAVDEEVSEARKILGSMHKVMIKHKLILIAIILVLIFLIIIAIYVGVGTHKNNKVTSPPQTSVDPITVPPTWI